MTMTVPSIIMSSAALKFSTASGPKRYRTAFWARTVKLEAFGKRSPQKKSPTFRRGLLFTHSPIRLAVLIRHLLSLTVGIWLLTARILLLLTRLLAAALLLLTGLLTRVLVLLARVLVHVGH